MNTFADKFDSTAAFLRANGVSPKLSKGMKASLADVEMFKKKTGVVLPESFFTFHTDFADGFEFRWEKTEDEWGCFSIQSLEQLAEDRLNWDRNVRDFLDDPTSLDRCIESTFRAEAFDIWRKMRSWVPFWDEGNGDHFCVDAASECIVYDQHDWFDGFGSIAKTNGIVAGDSLADFIQKWSHFCFQPNKRLWWGEFGKFGAIKWDPKYFNSKFFRLR